MTEFHQESQTVHTQYNAEIINFGLQSRPDGDVSLLLSVMKTPSVVNDQLFASLPQELRLQYRARSSGDSIIIEPSMDYLDLVASGGPVRGIPSARASFDWGFPNLDLRIVNNSSRTIFLSNIAFDVEHSTIDYSPIPVIQQNFFMPLHIPITNQGWGSMEGAALAIDILSVTAEPSHEGGFAHNITIGSIDEYVAVDISDALRARGVDVDFLRQVRPGGLSSAIVNSPEFMRAYGPFPEKLVQVCGMLRYRGRDISGNRQHHGLKFTTLVSLMYPGPGIPAPPSFQYSVQFKAEGQNYTVEEPISHVLKPYEADRFNVSIGVERSSVHAFRTRVEFNDGDHVVSRAATLHVFVPRSSVGVIRPFDASSLHPSDASVPPPPPPPG